MRRRYVTVFTPLLCSLLTFASVAQAQNGIWTTREELASAPTSGPAWSAVLSEANGDTSKPDVANQDDPTNIRVLGAALAYARSGDTAYRDKVIRAIEVLVAKGHPGGRSLAWGREVGAYAIAADLVGYRTPAFEQWLRNMADVWLCEQLDVSLRKMFERRPSNWGAHAFGSLAAIYAYLGDRAALSAIRSYFIQSIDGPNPGLSYGSDVSWHVDERNLRWINPRGAVKNGINIDGVIPDDMRRGGPLSEPPAPTGYMWEGQQGFILGARILERAGLPIWNVGDAALLRAAYALEVTFATKYGSQFKATGEDQWMLRFLGEAYGVNINLASSEGWGSGKNIGLPYVLLGANGPRPTPTPTAQPSPTPTVKPSPTPTVKPSPTPTVKPSPTPTAQPSPSATPTVKPTANPSPTPNPSFTPTPAPSPSNPASVALTVSYVKSKFVFTAKVGDQLGTLVPGTRVSLVRNLNRKNSPDREIRSAVTDSSGVAAFPSVGSIRAKDTYFAKVGTFKSNAISGAELKQIAKAAKKKKR